MDLIPFQTGPTYAEFRDFQAHTAAALNTLVSLLIDRELFTKEEVDQFWERNHPRSLAACEQAIAEKLDEAKKQAMDDNPGLKAIYDLTDDNT